MDSLKRADLYVKCGDWHSAARECKERGVEAKLEFVTILFFCFFTVLTLMCSTTLLS